MNKRDARYMAESTDYTAGELRLLIDSQRGTNKTSTVNKGLTKERALDVLAKAIAEIPDDQIVNPADGIGQRKVLKVKTVQNILREAG